MLNKVLKSVVLMLFASSVFAGDMVKIQTAKGEVEVPKNPQKVAVLDLGVLENLGALGVKAGAVNDKLYSDMLESKFKGTPRIGTLFEPNLEKLITYQPDLIIVAARSSKALDKLKNIAPTIDLTLGGEAFIDSSKKRLLELGKIFDKTEKAQEVSAEIDSKLANLGTLAKNQGKALFVLTSGPKISAYGKGSRFGWIHEDLGIAEAVENVKEATHGDPISHEFIKEANPDWLIVFDRSAAIGKQGESAKAVLDNALVAETPAWKKQQVIYLDPSIYLAIGGIEGIEKTIDTVTEAFKNAK